MIKAKIKWLYDRFLKIRGTPREIALGMALGLFIGFSPTMGLQIIIGVFIASLLKWSKIATLIGVQITNPITAPLIYSPTYYIGAKVIGLETMFVFKGSDLSSLFEMIKQAPQIFLALTIGGVLIGFPVACIGYAVVYRMMNNHQKKLKELVLTGSQRIGKKLKPPANTRKEDKK